MIKYSYPSDKRPDTSEDVLSLGFISPSFDAVLVRVDSDPKINNDYLQLEIVSVHDAMLGPTIYVVFTTNLKSIPYIDLLQIETNGARIEDERKKFPIMIFLSP